MKSITRHAPGECGRQCARSAFEIGARTHYRIGVDARTGVTESEMLALDRRRNGLIVDAGVGHQDAERAEGLVGAAFQFDKRLVMFNAAISIKIRTTRVGYRRHLHTPFTGGALRQILQKRHARFTQRFGVRHQMHLRHFNHVRRIKEAAHFDQLLHRPLARFAFGARQQRLLVIR